MMPTTLPDWLEHLQRLHPQAIALGLDRAGEVWRRLGAPTPARVVITVGGTNGKGSTVALLEAMLAAAGKRVGSYTSPHLLRYNERVRVAGIEADDAALVDAFARVEAARLDGAPVALTYFEFGTLAALWLFAQRDLDVALLEVGLGGRLDAVNLIDADAAIVTTVDLDHQDLLGPDRDSIGREKAGIFRAGRPAIIGDAGAPQGLIEVAVAKRALLHVAGRDFHAEIRPPGRWRWRSGDADLVLPLPALPAPCQVANAAAAIAALQALRSRLGWFPEAIARGVAGVQLGARLQRFAGPPELIVDVAHNPQAATVLAAWLAAQPVAGRTLAVFGALADKDVEGVVAALAGQVGAWFPGGLDGASPRGLEPAALFTRLRRAVPESAVMPASGDIRAALAAACAAAQPGDRVLAFGSFFVAAAALGFMATRAAAAA